jgi:hypothetical protein
VLLLQHDHPADEGVEEEDRKYRQPTSLLLDHLYLELKKKGSQELQAVEMGGVGARAEEESSLCQGRKKKAHTMNTTLARVLHTKPTETIASLMKNFFKMKEKMRHTNAEIVKGKTQYPRIHTDWKKEMVPPRSCGYGSGRQKEGGYESES